MLIEILNVSPISTTVGASGKPYKFFEVAYKNHGYKGQVEAKKVNEYSREVFSTLQSATSGMWFEISREKDATGKFWNWTKAVQTTQGNPAETAPTENEGPNPTVGKKVVGSNYETAEERAWYRTRYFRTYAVGHAVSILKVDKAVPQWTDVQALAAQIEQWLNRSSVENPMQEIVNMEDDIPQ